MDLINTIPEAQIMDEDNTAILSTPGKVLSPHNNNIVQIDQKLQQSKVSTPSNNPVSL